MKIFNNIFRNKLPKRFPENAKGDFYVEDQVCIACGAPEGEAPDLIDHSKVEYGHCYFKKQPQTPEELDSAISAMEVSCISGIRYGGKDEAILKRLYEMGQEDQCDYKPIGEYQLIIRNKVVFQCQGTIEELSKYLMSQLLLSQSFPNKEIVKFETNDADNFEFVFRWTDGFTGVIFQCRFDVSGLCQIEMKTEKDAYLISLRGMSSILNLILSNYDKVRDILWFDLAGKTYDQTQILY